MEKEAEASKKEICQIPEDQLYDALASHPGGLTRDEIEERQKEYGPNVISETKKTPLAFRFLANLYHTFALLLWVASALAFVAGIQELGWAIIAVIFINAIFSFAMEFQAERATEALKKIMPARARVMRSGELQEVQASELVPGDIIVLQEGDNISADARLTEENELRVNAATLTGESAPVRKMSYPVSGEGLTIPEIPNLVLTGTSVALGSGKAVVFATGMKTEFGKIASMTQKVKHELSPLQKDVNRVAMLIAVAALSLGSALFGISVLFTSLTLAAAVTFAIGMIVANVPEGLLPTVTLSLALAVKKMTRENALVKKLSGVETLGSTSVICTDKTGTLTQNEMTVRQLWANGVFIDVSGGGYDPMGKFSCQGKAIDENDEVNLELLIEIAGLCNNSRLVEPGEDRKRWSIIGDPTEAALLVTARKWGFDTGDRQRADSRLRELPFESHRKRMSVIHPYKGGAAPESAGRTRIAYIKGAPSEMIPLCTNILDNNEARPLGEEERAAILARNDDMARSGLRVLAMAYRLLPEDTELTEENVERDMIFAGLMAMMDPPRPEVETAISKCRSAGIRVIMITGDYGLTAESVARRIGLFGSEPATIINGGQLENMTDGDLSRALDDPNVLFARVSPEHKMRIAATLRKKNQIVAMTGDGVNDAPALKTANVGVAMGISGTDVAKEAAVIILTDDNFATIVNAVTEGRVVYDNMKKFLAYIFAHLTPEVIPFVGFVLLGIPLPITVMQILAIDLGTETLPALALGAEAGEPDIMERPPRPRKEKLVDRSMLFHAWVFLGLIEAVLVMGGFFWVLYDNGWTYGQELDESSHIYLLATTMTFAGIVVAQIGTAFSCRARRISALKMGFLTNRWLLWGILFEVVLLLAIVYLPPLQDIFATTGLHWKYWLLLVTFPPVILLCDELRKYLNRKLFIKSMGGGPS